MQKGSPPAYTILNLNRLSSQSDLRQLLRRSSASNGSFHSRWSFSCNRFNTLAAKFFDPICLKRGVPAPQTCDYFTRLRYRRNHGSGSATIGMLLMGTRWPMPKAARSNTSKPSL